MLNIFELELDIQAKMQQAKVPGLALAIIRDRKVWYARGFGVTSVETQQPVTEDTFFRLGSITKPMTAFLILQLVRYGHLNLDVPVRQYVSDIQFSVPEYADQITLRHLLSHTAGLQTSHAPFGRRDPGALAAYIKEDFPKYEFVAPPGVLYSYSNPGIRLAGYVAERVMGKSYTELMELYVFHVLGMWQATFDPTIAMTYAVAQSHDVGTDGNLYVQHRFADNAAQYPSGGLMTHILDLAAFAINGVIEDPMGDEIEHIKYKHQQQLAAFQYKLKDDHYGLGINLRIVKGRRLVGHDGSISTFGSKLVCLPREGIGVAMLFNRAPGFWGIAAEIIDQIIEGVTDQATHTEIRPSRRSGKTSEELYFGTYLGLERGYAEVIQEGSNMALLWNGEKYTLKRRFSDLWMAGEIGVGFVGGYLMIDGSPLARTERHLVQLTPNPAYDGLYRGVDELKIRVENGEMWVFSEEVGMELRCLPLDEKTFASSIGLLEFGSNSVLQSKAYLMYKVSAR